MSRGFEWDIGCAVMSSYDVDGFLGVQIDAYGEQGSGVHPYEAHHLHGFISRPADPVADASGAPDTSNACNVMFALEGGRGHAWVLEDPRVVPFLPTLRPGEAMFYGAAGQFVRCKADGSISLMTTDATVPGPAGSPILNGRNIFLDIKPTGLVFVAPWGRLTFDATGFHVRTQGGARLDLGSISGLPAPLDKIDTYASMSAAMVSMEGSVVSQGPTTGTAEPAAKAITLTAYLTALAAAVQAVLTAAASPDASSSGPVAAAQALLTPLLAPPLTILSNTAVE